MNSISVAITNYMYVGGEMNTVSYDIPSHNPYTTNDATCSHEYGLSTLGGDVPD